tara:strand:- start:5207 stop:5476 length:270 start_codon:yes stop_codon:yes gene_type:complete
MGSKRGDKIKKIVDTTIIDMIWEKRDELKGVLEQKLKKELDFETTVSNIEGDHRISFGSIVFENDNGKYSSIDFSVHSDSAMNQEDYVK